MWRRSFKLPQAKPRVKMAGLENSLLVGETRQNNKSKYINLNSLSVLVNALHEPIARAHSDIPPTPFAEGQPGYRSLAADWRNEVKLKYLT